MKNIKKNINKYTNNITLMCLLFLLLLIILIIMFYYINKNILKLDNNFEYYTEIKNESTIIVPKYCIGFFACCCDILKHIIDYYNSNKNIPKIIDCSQQFDIYKPLLIKDDITYHFFNKYNENNENNENNESNINIQQFINFNFSHQYYKYSDIKYYELKPFIEKYFSPSQNIINIEHKLIKKYNIDFNNYCAVYYRGTDKKEETIIGGFDTYIDKINELLKTDNNMKFIIQSDNQNFIDIVKSKISNSISFDENVASYTEKGIHNEHTSDDNYIIMKNFLAIVLIMSKCKNIICSSGNCSLWIMLFKGNGNNINQFLNDKWI